MPIFSGIVLAATVWLAFLLFRKKEYSSAKKFGGFVAIYVGSVAITLMVAWETLGGAASLYTTQKLLVLLVTVAIGALAGTWWGSRSR